MTLLSLENLTVRRGACPVVDEVTLSVGRGAFVGLIGPNGAGKTSLMRAALGLLPHEGRSNLATMLPEVRARHAAWLPQMREIAWPVSVEALVRLGRTPHRRAGGQEADHRAVANALARMGLDGFKDRRATELSGGEQARVLIARALAQETSLLLADEPIAGLDPAHQLGAMEVFAALADEGRTVVAALHDLGQAARFCTRLVMMHQGRVAADGLPAKVLSPGRLAEVFGIRAQMIDTPHGPLFQPLERLT
ncbi:ABC transporter ATP-binding protein [Alkalilacustris brevis]|uniref:ABC transporter ATP-binding protein n=1 Tax=Alkalilacustris brevis TaxID=2026338 RepID=UPI000E0D9776|nr:ABC transporter ATP-binding protein [Alkalilacustris brevis]